MFCRNSAKLNVCSTEQCWPLIQAKRVEGTAGESVNLGEQAREQTCLPPHRPGERKGLTNSKSSNNLTYN